MLQGKNIADSSQPNHVMQNKQEPIADIPSSSNLATPPAPQEILYNAAGLPIVPYRLRPRALHDEPEQHRAVKKQKVAFCGSALDSADAKWYEDDVVMDVCHSNPALERYPSPLNEQTSSSSVGPSPPEAMASREVRTLMRYDIEQAVDRYLHTFDDNN